MQMIPCLSFLLTQEYSSISRAYSDPSLTRGLHVNYHKSFMVPINVETFNLQYLANTFGCLTKSMPFTYLGLPLSIHKPTTQDFAPLLQKIESRLIGIIKMLSYHGRLILVNSVFLLCPLTTCAPFSYPKSC